MESIWHRTERLREFAPLYGEALADTVIIGGGMAGLLLGYELNRKGVSNVILERNRIASGVTGNTTAKITLQHNLIYSRLIRDFGLERARQYAAANRRALDRYAEIVGKEQIDCGFTRLPACVYSLDETSLLTEELAAAARLGIDAEFTTGTELPFPVKGALRFPDQAQFHPLAFLGGILGDLRVYEHTEALELTDDGVITADGRVNARNIVIATHYPFLNVPGYYFLRIHQQRSYVVALEGASKLREMYIDADDAGYSFRGFGELLLLGGAGHRTGQNENGGSYEKLLAQAERWWPGVKEAGRWSAQDCMTIDGVPYIGRYSEKTPRLFVATGFNKWGMTSAMAAAMILASRIAGETCEFAEVFTPQRFNAPAGAGKLLQDGMKAAKSLLVKPLTPPRAKLEELPNGHGGIVSYDGGKAGVYKNEAGECFIVSPKCPHMGCELSWNPDEKTWDCPCHGSRFRYDGTLIDAPAQSKLEIM